MIWVYVAIAVSVVLIGAFIAYEVLAEYADGGAFIGILIVGIVLVILVGVAIVVPFQARHDETVCGRRGVELERDVRFIRYSSFGWDCITPSEDGWVSLDRVIKAEGGNG